MVECKTIFYSARKTSLCERALKKSFSELDLDMSDISFAADRESLCNALTEAFGECNIVFVIGGLGFGDDNMYNLAGWLLTLISAGSACLIVGAALILLPYAAALLWTFIGICIVIGVVAALLGG